MNNEVPTITPENERLNAELRRLQAEFLEVFTRHNDMVENQSAVLTSIYLEMLGHLQLELLEKQTEASRLKMKMQMIQAALNRNEKPDLDMIDFEIDLKLQEYYQQIRQQADDLDKAKKVLSSLLSEEEAIALKEIFRLLCKRLHPDVNPNQSEYEKDLFIRVKAAYDRNALAELQDILLSLDESGMEDIDHVAANEKEARIQHLTEQIEKLTSKIELLKQSFPFNIEHQILDKEYIKETQQSLREQIIQAQEEISKYLEIISIMTDE